MIVLASASPRRRALLAATGLVFRVLPADVDEGLAADLPAERAARELAERKARAVAGRSGPEAARGVLWIVGADTIVAVAPGGGAPERMLGKPADAREAEAMLAALSGTRHRVVTGVCVLRLGPGEGACCAETEAETTWVRMREIAADEMAAYVASGEWRDKAGGYAIQETADRFVTGLEGGGFDNVVGLPVERTLALLGRLGAPLPGRGR